MTMDATGVRALVGERRLTRSAEVTRSATAPAGPPAAAAFDELVRVATPRLLRTARLLTGSHASAEDLVQTALVQTWTHWASIREPAAAEGYARQCMVRTSASWWRRRWTGEVPTEVLPDRAGAVGSSTYDAVDTASAVGQALGSLDPRSRAVLVLRFFEDLSEADTAAALDISVGTVKSRTSRALVKLRALDLWEGLAP